jgi:hypothetical protein
MWIVITVVSIVFAAVVLFWRLLSLGQRTPDENDADRQHEVPGAHRPPPTLPD